MNERRFAIWLGVTSLIATLAILVAAWALYSRFAQTNAYRRADQRIWTSVICQIETAVTRSKTLTPAQIKASLRFYDSLLVKDVQTAGCGLIERKP